MDVDYDEHRTKADGRPLTWTTTVGNRRLEMQRPTTMVIDDVATLSWPNVGVKPNTWKNWGLGVLRDSRMFRARQKGPKHLALKCS
jgi:hypothetical protein